MHENSMLCGQCITDRIEQLGKFGAYALVDLVPDDPTPERVRAELQLAADGDASKTIRLLRGYNRVVDVCHAVIGDRDVTPYLDADPADESTPLDRAMVLAAATLQILDATQRPVLEVVDRRNGRVYFTTRNPVTAERRKRTSPHWYVRRASPDATTSTAPTETRNAMRDQYANDTVVVEITVRHTHAHGTVERRHEVITRVGSDDRPQWLNRRVVAGIEAAQELIAADFNITADDVRLGRSRDFVTARPDID